MKRKSGGSSNTQPVRLFVDNQEVALLAPSTVTSGGDEGHRVEPGNRRIKATWSGPGGQEQQEETIDIAPGQAVTTTLSLA